MANSAKLAVVQMSCSSNTTDNIEKALSYVHEAATNGANIVLLQELFENIYFPQLEHPEHFALANEIEGHPFLTTFQALAKELGVVLPISFFEKAGQAYYNSLMMYDADGSALGLYRKSHIPDGPSYEEKYYFNPGDTGFKTWRTKFGRVGVGICWDQWFPEAARAMVLQGADLLLYPTAIGSEPADMSLAVQGEDAAGLDAIGLDAVGLDAVGRCGSGHQRHVAASHAGPRHQQYLLCGWGQSRRHRRRHDLLWQLVYHRYLRGQGGRSRP